MIITNNFTMALDRRGVAPVVDAVQGDSHTREIEISLTYKGQPWQIPDNTTAAIRFKKPDGKSGLYDTLPDKRSAYTIAGNVVTVALAPEVLTAEGKVDAAVALYKGTEVLGLFPFVVSVAPNPAGSQSISNNYYYLQTWDDVNAAIGQLGTLLTKNKSSLVVAVNEVAKKAGDNEEALKKQVDSWRMDEAGYLYLLAGGKEVIGPIGPFQAQGGTGGGADGFSPIAKVTETAEGAEITITDKNGTTKATAKHGRDGKDGADGLVVMGVIPWDEEMDIAVGVTLTFSTALFNRTPAVGDVFDAMWGKSYTVFRVESVGGSGATMRVLSHTDLNSTGLVCMVAIPWEVGIGLTLHLAASQFNRAPLVGDVFTAICDTFYTILQVERVDGDNVEAKAVASVALGGGGSGGQGPQGPQGEPGKDGFSPGAKVSQTETGATITITDANGTTTANILNGKDYVLTEVDKQEIAEQAAELVEVPEGGGGSGGASGWQYIDTIDLSSGALSYEIDTTGYTEVTLVNVTALVFSGGTMNWKDAVKSVAGVNFGLQKNVGTVFTFHYLGNGYVAYSNGRSGDTLLNTHVSREAKETNNKLIINFTSVTSGAIVIAGRV